MITMLIRADDLGMSAEVNRGILETITAGLVKSTGLMPNMPEAADGVKLVKDTGVSIGQHTNLCLGYPCADPSLIPSLLKADGTFKSSRTFRESFMNGIDLIDVDEAVIEIEAQYMQFKKLVGREPDYFEAHAIASDNLSKALQIVAEKYHLPYSDMTPMQSEGTFNGHRVHQCEMESMKKEYDPFHTLTEAVQCADEDMPNIFVCHPGYVDDFLLANSSLTYNREKEINMLCDVKTKEYLKEKDITLVSYRDIL